MDRSYSSSKDSAVCGGYRAGCALAVVSHYLVRDLYAEERSKMEIWSEAMRTLNKADENTDLNLVLKVINDNNTIPVIVVDKMGRYKPFVT